jgi:hypothetical protein
LKKIAAILLLSVYLFDLGGYLAVHRYMEYRSDRFFEKQTAKGMYNRNDLVDIAIPVSMPGIHDWKNFEPISGCIRFDSKAYNYVAMKITTHTLFLKCVPDYKTTRLNTLNILSASPIKDVPVPKKEHVPYAGSRFGHGFSFAFRNVVLKAPVISLTQHTATYLQKLIHRHTDIPKQPPKQFC